MTADFWPWTILQITPTDDRKTIREAYSRLLKALDHEAETEAYMQLRDARDAALSGHFLHPPASNDEADDDFGLGSPLPDDAVPVAEAPPAEPELQEKPAFTVDYSDEDEKRFQRVVDLFLGEGALAPAESEELKQHLDTLFADDRMGDLGHYARVEGWLAQLLADRYPRGAELFPKAADYFHWSERAQELGVHPAIPWLFNAHEGVSLVNEIETPGHAYHREWMELKRGKPDGVLWFRTVDKPRMANLIDTIRRDYPWLEQDHWQPQLVERWEKKVAGGAVRGPSPWTWFWMICVLFAIVPRFAATDATAPAANFAPVAEADAVVIEQRIADFLERNFPKATSDGRTAETLRKAVPKIYASLEDRARNRLQDDAVADNIMMKAITDNYYSMIDKLPYDRQVAEAKFRASAAKKLRDDPQGCVQLIARPATYMRSGNAAAILTDDYRNHMFAVVHDDYAGVKWVSVSKKMVLPGDVVGKLIQRSGLSDAKLRATMSAERPVEADYCRAMGSLFELLTEIPREQASKILPAVL